MPASRLVPLAAAALLAMAPAGHAAGVPRAVFPELQKDLGLVQKGAKVPVTFVVANNGTADLHVLEVRPTCGCTTVSFDPVVPPGGQGALRLVFDSSRQRGVQRKGVLVRLDDPARPRVALALTGFVKPIVDVLPDDIVTLSGEAGRSISHVVLASEDPALRPALARVTLGPGDARLKVELAPADAASRVAGAPPHQWLVTVTTTRETPAGRHVGQLLLSTGVATVPELSLALVANLTPPR